MVKICIVIITVFACIVLRASPRNDSLFSEITVTLHTATGDIFGTLTIAGNNEEVPVALIIAGSGATDRNGNNAMMKNESLHLLAIELAKNKIASLRFDKRGIGESMVAAKAESDLRFENYIDDARGWIELLKKDSRFSKVFVIGHSEGSLIGMIASLNQAAGFISLAGAGKSADKILKEQLAGQPTQIKDMCMSIIDSLVKGSTVKDINPMLNALFRPGVQPYLISWFRYDPQFEISKLNIPVLIAQGTCDIQVSEDDAKLLNAANPKSQLRIIRNMNHIFKIVGADRTANIATYNNPLLPVSEELVIAMVSFIRSN